MAVPGTAWPTYARAPPLLDTRRAMNAPMLIRNATLPDGRTGIDLLVQDGRIAAVGPALRRARRHAE